MSQSWVSFSFFFFLYWTQQQPPSLLLISRWKDLLSEPWKLEEDRAGRDEEVLFIFLRFFSGSLSEQSWSGVKAPSHFLCWGDPLIACYQEMCKMGVRWFPRGPSFLCSIKKYIFTCQCLGSARVWLLENPSGFSKWMHLSKLQALWIAPPWSHPWEILSFFPTGIVFFCTSDAQTLAGPSLVGVCGSVCSMYYLFCSQASLGLWAAASLLEHGFVES